ncbi:Protein TIFY 11B [Euphorbia peplus]|nr:Protein TIFY 11B [Euphorbia peplus]
MASMAHRYSGKSASPEKSNFAQTCNLLSQYLKERGSIGDISRKLETTTGQETPRTTLNLLPNMENSEKSMDLLFPSSDLLSRATPATPGTPQMTIFYAGKVIVLDDIPADKAEEIMAFANTSAVRAASKNPSPQELNFLDLPIARRASLHRFFEKRRDRMVARAPYQLHNPSKVVASKPEEMTPWFDLEARLSSRQLELKL